MKPRDRLLQFTVRELNVSSLASANTDLDSDRSHLSCGKQAGARFRLWLSSVDGHTWAFWGLVGVYLAPIWAFTYLPTQDGPSHLYNAIILRDLVLGDSVYEKVFSLRLEFFPNWMSHILLAGFTFVMPALLAEKILASVYVVGFACGLRYFLRAFDKTRWEWTAIGLLFVYNRCFFMGFYNFCLSMVLFWFTLGTCLRYDGRRPVVTSIVVCLLLLVSFFSHFMGYGMSVIAVGVVLAFSRKAQSGGVLPLVVAALPSFGFAINYCIHTGLFGGGTGGGILSVLADWWRNRDVVEHVITEIGTLNEELFSLIEPRMLPLGMLVFLLLGTLLIFTLLEKTPSTDQSARTSHVRISAALGGLFAVLYFLLPDPFGWHGGFVHARLAMFPPLLWLACFRLPSIVPARRLVQVAIGVLVALHLFLVGRHFHECNRDIQEFVAGVDHVGSRKTLLVLKSGSAALVDHLGHAIDYYCLETANTDPDNYEAFNAYFPVTFRAERQPRSSTPTEMHRLFRFDYLLVWGLDAPRVDRELIQAYRETFRQGRLTILSSIDEP